MMSRISKKHPFSFRPAQPEAGVSLLMAILVLAALTAISFSLATIIFVEIRASADVLRTERALYSAYAITEIGTFKNQRGADINYSDSTYSSINNVNLVTTEVSTATSPYTDGLTAGVTKQYDLVDPNDTNGGGGYGGIKVVYASTGSSILRINLYSINPNPPAGETGKTLVTSSTLESFNTSWQDFTLSTAYQYELDLTNTDANSGISVNIYSYSDAGITAKGLPNIGLVEVDIVATYLGLTRKYQARIPTTIGEATSTSFRYLRVRTPSSNSWVAWNEIEAYDTSNVLVNVSSVSASPDPFNSTSSAHDGDTSTWWSAGASNGTITFDYGSVQAFSRVRFSTRSTPDPATVTHYIETSTDGVNFVPLTSFGTSIQSGVWLAYP